MMKISFVTGSRADYGLLRFLIQDMAAVLPVQIMATGSHLSPRFGETYREIEADGFRIDAKIDCKISDDSPQATTQAMARAVAGFGEALQEHRPDLLFVLGDRYEIFAAVQAALVALIPVAHIAGGDTTEGAIDEAFRHSISKMSHLHFTTNAMSAQRLIQLGENPENIHNVGHIGIDNILRTPTLDRREVEHKIGFSLKKRNLLITFHPETLGGDAMAGMDELTQSLAELGSEVGILFTLANADADGQKINRRIGEFCKGRDFAKSFPSLGRELYLNLMRQVDAVVGNSSSGIYEAPFLKKPSVNIGDRQKGRQAAPSVLSCIAKQAQISAAIQDALTKDYSRTIQPYGDGHAIERIVRIVESVNNPQALLKKHFFSAETGT